MTVESALLAAFAAHLGPIELISHRLTPWHSATFGGGRHVFEIAPASAYDLGVFARAISEVDIAIPRGFVADVAVVSNEDDRAEVIVVEVLTIDA